MKHRFNDGKTTTTEYNMAFPHDGKKFKEGNKHGKGRPKKLTSAVLQELESEGYEEVTQAHVKEAYQRLINLDQEKLTELYNDKKVAMLIRIVAKAILDKKGFEIIEKMLDRAHGKATNKTEVTGADGKDLDFTINVITGENMQPFKPE